ncbi:MAG: hypothetical protein ABIH03_02000, partial [Pseudomonadota bacterium]
MRKSISFLIIATLAGVALGQTFTDVNTSQYWGKTGIPKLTEALDANFEELETGGTLQPLVVSNVNLEVYGSNVSLVAGGAVTLASARVDISGTFTDHVIDIQPTTTLGDSKAVYIGTWGTEAEFNDGGGLFRIYGKAGSGGTASANIFVRTLTDSTTPPIGAQFYTDSDAATPGPKGMSAVDA